MWQIFSNVVLKCCLEGRKAGSLLEGDIGVCGIAVLDHFSCGISGILIPNCGIAVFSGPAGCGFLVFWAGLEIIFKVLLRFPSF